MKVCCFDLDDTLYKEIDFLHSAYREISKYAMRQLDYKVHASVIFETMLSAYLSGHNAFESLNISFGLNIPILELRNLYRNHIPDITLPEESYNLLRRIKECGYVIGIITDGRSVQQRNKICSLGLMELIKDEDIIISEEFGAEKPSEQNYVYFMKRYPDACEYIYVGDNLKKDFIAPNKLGWETICLLDDGRNIHKQDFTCEQPALPKYTVRSLDDVKLE